MADDLWRRHPAEIVQSRIRFQTKATAITVIILCSIWAIITFITFSIYNPTFFYFPYLMITFTMASGILYLKIMRKKIVADPYIGPEEAIVSAFKAAGFSGLFYILSWPFGGLPPFSGLALVIAIVYYRWGKWGRWIPGSF